MAEDLMQTQTGGAGDTVQLAPQVNPTPEQFEAKLPNVAAQEPPSAPPTQEEPTLPPTEPPVDSEPPSPVVQQSLVDAGKEAEQGVEDMKVSDIPKNIQEQSKVIQPTGEGVGFVDWFSGDAVKSITDEENAEIEKLLNEPDLLNRDNLPVLDLDSEYANEPYILDGVVVNEGKLVDDEILGTSKANAIDDVEEDDDYTNPVIDPVDVEEGPISSFVQAADKKIPLGMSPQEWQAKQEEIAKQYPGWRIVVSDDGKSVSVEKDEVQKAKPTTKGGEKVEPKSQAKAPDVNGKTLTYSPQPNNEYMTDGVYWYKRKKGAIQDWYTITNTGSINALNRNFKTSVKPIKTYSYPGKENYEYAIIKNNWNIRKKGESEWNTITEPSRVKELNRHNKTSAVVPSPKMSGVDSKINLAVSKVKQSGVGFNSSKVGGVSFDSSGNPITSTAMKANQSSLFTADSKILAPAGGAGFEQRYAEQQIADINKQRQTEIDFINNKNISSAQKTKEIQDVNNKYNALTREQNVNIEQAKQQEKAYVKQTFTEPLPQTKIKRNVDVTKEFGLDKLGINISNDNIPLIDKDLGFKLDKMSDLEKDELDYQAQAFVGKDLDAWRNTGGIGLSDEQFKEIKAAQVSMRRLYQAGEKEGLSFAGWQMLAGEMSKISEHYENSVKVNMEINNAAVQGKTLDKYLLDDKKKLILKYDNIDNPAIKHAKDLFNATASMHDFIDGYIKDGKIYVDDKGIYRVKSGLSDNEKNYINEKLGGYINQYNDLKKSTYNTYQDDIVALRKRKETTNSLLNGMRNALSGMDKDSDEYKSTLKKINAAKNRITDLNNRIDELKNGSRAFFSTDPKAILASTSGVMKQSGFLNQFNATPSNISSKQRFDLTMKALIAENDNLARQYGINTSHLDAVGARFRSMLDWNTIGAELSPQEKRWFANQKVINSLLPIYLNNENGIIEESAGFFDAFIAGAKNMVIGSDIAGSEGDFTGTTQSRVILNYLGENGFTKEDLANEINIKDLEKRQNVSWVSAEGAGDILGTVGGLISVMSATSLIGAGALKAVKGVANLIKVGKAGTAIGLGDRASKAYKAYETAMKQSTFGKYMFEAVEQAAQYEFTGQVAGITADEMNWMSGFIGSFAGSTIAGAASKLPIQKALPIVESIFGKNTDKALNVFRKFGDINKSAIGETAEEFAQELTSIYKSTLDGAGFFDEVVNRFGDFDEAMKFVVSSYVMGGAFGMLKSSKADDLYESMSDEKREAVDNVITQVRKDYEAGTEAYNDAAEVASQEIQLENNLDETPQGEADNDAKQEEGGLVFNFEEPNPNQAKIEEGEITESEFKEPVNLTEGDTENKAGLPSEVREGEKPVETQPFPEASQEETSPSRVVQEEQEVAPTEEGLQFDLPRAGEEVAPKEGELQFELPKNEDLEFKRKEAIEKERKILEEIIESSEKNEIFKKELEKLNSNPKAYFNEKAEEQTSYYLNTPNTHPNIEVFKKDAKERVEIANLFEEEAQTPEITESTLTREFDLTEEQEVAAEEAPASEFQEPVDLGLIDKALGSDEEIMDEASTQVADVMADEKLTEEEKDSKVDEIVMDTKKKMTVSKLRKGDKSMKSEPTRAIKEKVVEEAKVKEEKIKEEKVKAAKAPTEAKTETATITESREQLTRGDLKNITIDRMVEIYDGLTKEQQDEHFHYGISQDMSSQPIKTRFFSSLKNAVGEQEAARLIKEKQAPSEAKTEPTKVEQVETTEEVNPFTDLTPIKSMPLRSAKRKQAISDFNAKHGEGAFDRVSKIDSNFDEIVTQLEDNNVVKKEC